MNNETVLSIITDHLRAIGADGLANEFCGCGLDDLAPCQECCLSCVPAMATIATEPGDEYDIGDVIYVPIPSTTGGAQEAMTK